MRAEVVIGFATGVKMFTASASPDACIRTGSKELLEEELAEKLEEVVGTGRSSCSPGRKSW